MFSRPKTTIDKLAFEVLSLIFEYWTDYKHENVDPTTWKEHQSLQVPYVIKMDTIPLIASAVCRKFRYVALHSPRIWRNVRIDPLEDEEVQRKRLTHYISRSGVVPLEVVYNTYPGVYPITPISDSLTQLLLPTVPRWISFQARFKGPAHMGRFFLLLAHATSLQVLFLTQLAMDPQDSVELPPYYQVHSLAPQEGVTTVWGFRRLRWFAYHDVEPTSVVAPTTLAHLITIPTHLEALWLSCEDRKVLPRILYCPEQPMRKVYLRHMAIHPAAMLNTMNPVILDILEFPVLHSLEINLLECEPRIAALQLLFEFFRRHAEAIVRGTACPIDRLRIVAARGDGEVLRLLGMLPDVRHLVIMGSVIECTAQFARAFGTPLSIPEYYRENIYRDEDLEFEEMLAQEQKAQSSEEVASPKRPPSSVRENLSLLSEADDDIPVAPEVKPLKRSFRQRATYMDSDSDEEVGSEGSCGPPSEGLRERSSSVSSVTTSTCSSIGHAPWECDGEDLGSDSGLSLPTGNWTPGLDDRNIRMEQEMQDTFRRDSISNTELQRKRFLSDTTHYGWLLPNLQTLHFHTTCFFRGENTVLLARMLKHRQLFSLANSSSPLDRKSVV